MGVRGLTGWIAWAAPSSIQHDIDWSSLRGARVGVDILGFLYRAKAQRQDPLVFLATFIAAAKRHKLHLIPIFDGKPPEEKRGALAQRTATRSKCEQKKIVLENDLANVPMTETQRTVIETNVRRLETSANYLSAEERDQAKKLFYAAGILPLNASGEADNVLAYFSKHGYFDAIISNDLDLLPRGVTTLLVPEPYALPGDKSGWKVYHLPSILKEVEFTYEQFVDMCILMGCDYTYGLRSLPFKSAYWSIKYRGPLHKTLTALQVLPSDEAIYEKARNIIVGNTESIISLMGSKQWEKLAAPPPCIEPEALASFRTCSLASLSEADYSTLLGADHGYS
jgi:flap endonuclease-1